MASPTRSSHPRQRCKDVARHSCGPDTYAVNGLNQDAFVLGLSRSTSDTDLLSPDTRSTLTISSSHYIIGQSEDLVVTWDIKEEVDAGDWIGMYLLSKKMCQDVLLLLLLQFHYDCSFCAAIFSFQVNSNFVSPLR